MLNLIFIDQNGQNVLADQTMRKGRTYARNTYMFFIWNLLKSMDRSNKIEIDAKIILVEIVEVEPRFHYLRFGVCESPTILGKFDFSGPFTVACRGDWRAMPIKR